MASPFQWNANLHGPSSTLRRWVALVTAAAFCLATVNPNAAEFPSYEVGEMCAIKWHGWQRAVQDCSRKEIDYRDAVASIWGSLSEPAQSYCIDMAGQAHGSYRILYSCAVAKQRQ